MSVELLKARTALGKINTYLKENRLHPAVISFHDGLHVFLQSLPNLLKKEKEEFVRYLEKATYQISTDKTIKKIFPLQIAYTPGKEKELYTVIKALMEELNASAVDEAKSIMESMRLEKEEKENGLARAQNLLDNGEIDKARELFLSIIRSNEDDVDLKAEIGERFFRAGLYEEAIYFFLLALRDFPESVHLYNRLGIAHRKLKKFDESERFFLKGLEYAAENDENIYYNLGRMYADWLKWDKCFNASSRALGIRPSFDEAAKMRQFAQKKMKK